ncbi:multicopper oxidase family protein [Dactylosporangium matsuzakiense]|uniref:Spore coat protein A n=1 Tax=Dactylosporangium matsuzakiense TaxID=53360 RepID=A0A9W6KYJ2_9ACTN|nr:multicopper oxidase family protein [Dactylosporangium matsuzakiense]UWZ42426.1 multicopper oxidase family protein [Dactylosporangium matsuzakiense]GLL08795.1 spore coat protein A [Dactylosporangium matsuzakiense]
MRRRALLGLLAAVGGVGVPLLRGWEGSTSTGLLLPSRRPRPEPFAVALPIPPVLRPARVDAEGEHYEIVQRVAAVEILPGLSTQIWGYNGSLPGPTIVSRSGRPVTVLHRNELPVPTVAHLHGGRTPAASDGYPTDLLLAAGSTGHAARMPAMSDPQAVITSGSRLYSYPLDQPAGTLWYHDHRMDFTGPSVWRGLAGFHLVTDAAEDAVPLPRGARDLPLMVMDRSFGPDGELLYPSVDPGLVTPGVTGGFGAGVLGDVILVNGAPWPVADVDAARYRLRLLNASNARRYRLVLDPPGALVQIGADGGLLERPVRHDAVELAPAQRLDVVVDFSGYPLGQDVTVLNTFGEGPTGRVMRFRVVRAATDDTAVPAALPGEPGLSPGPDAPARTMQFRHATVGGMAGWAVNGAPFTPGAVHARVRRGAVEVWRLASDFHHPIHLHGATFRVLARSNGGPGPYDAGWRDTLDLRPAEQATIAVRFGPDPGRYVFHCHNLEHEDMAMMGNVVIE